MDVNDSKYIFVYQTVNEITGKTYIGVRSTYDLNDGYIGCGILSQSGAIGSSHFHKAVRKYGYDSFRRYILSFYDSYDEALEEERFIVNKDWVKNQGNYNSAIGGRGSSIFFMSDEKKSEMYKRVSVSLSASKKGTKASESAKINMSKAKKGKPSPKAFAVLKCTKDGAIVCEYRSIPEAAEKNGIVRSTLHINIQKGRPINNYLFRYKNNK